MSIELHTLELHFQICWEFYVFFRSKFAPWKPMITPDLLSRRFWEGISFLNFLEGAIPTLPLSKLCAVPFALQNRALLEGEKWLEGASKRGGRGVASKGGQKGKRTCEKQVRHKNTFGNLIWAWQDLPLPLGIPRSQTRKAQTSPISVSWEEKPLKEVQTMV